MTQFNPLFCPVSLSFTKCATPRKTTRRSGRASAATTPCSESCLRRRRRSTIGGGLEENWRKAPQARPHMLWKVPWAFARMLRQMKRQRTKQTAKIAAKSSQNSRKEEVTQPKGSSHKMFTASRLIIGDKSLISACLVYVLIILTGL